MQRPVRAPLAIFAVALGLVACHGPSESRSTVRLIDRFADATVENGVAVQTVATPIEWRFDGEGQGTRGWKSGEVKGLAVRDGRLRGRAATTAPIVHVERTAELDGDDLLHAVEISLRVSQGGELALTFDREEEPDLDAARNSPFPWPLTSPVVPGDELQTYTLLPTRPTALSRVRHLLVRPTDVEGATFEIASVRLVTRREHLSAIESGVGWHGMDDVFQETIVTRSPETVRYAVELPARPWLDLSLATIEQGPATFRISIEGGSGTGDPLVFERTISRPHRWTPVRFDLEGLDGQSIQLTLSLESERPGTLGFWGTAAIRSGVSARRAAELDAPQGVIVLLADTLRADHVNALGYARETAPVLTALAREGALAHDCVSQATWTKVSVPAIFTSLYPTTHTVAQFTDRLPVSADTLAEQFREAGHATLALTSISFTGQFTNLHQGYETFHESSSLRESSNSKTARELVDRLLPWLDTHRDVPFFVFLHVADPHSPYRAYAPFDTTWGGADDASALDESIEQVRPHIDNPVMKRFGMPRRSELVAGGVDPDEYVRRELDAYDGSIRAMDVEVGRLLERLRELELDDRTMIAFVSDHGTEFLDHDAHFHGHSVYGELNRVPLFLWAPGFVPGGVELEPTLQTIDMMPTVLEVAGLSVPERAQGQSLVPLIEAAAAGREGEWRRPAVTEKAFIDDSDLPGRSYGSIALISEGWKLIRNEPPPGDGREFELYDHRADPLNLRDLAADEPERVHQLRKLLEIWHQQALEARLDDSELEQNLSDEELKRLRGLGYLR